MKPIISEGMPPVDDPGWEEWYKHYLVAFKDAVADENVQVFAHAHNTARKVANEACGVTPERTREYFRALGLGMYGSGS